jgi:hypothetical protein
MIMPQAIIKAKQINAKLVENLAFVTILPDL